ncbi:hypothetical protein AYI69_g4845 [Smittium culicis]|uniref:Uncharacterized protein n=1 Tax=Smittium culicis TaxID=133412 RepID=A0A1R1YAD9_9FUNG|nr:hypothetical protein AYI69_g4845 [Smittium culicis]
MIDFKIWIMAAIILVLAIAIFAISSHINHRRNEKNNNTLSIRRLRVNSFSSTDTHASNGSNYFDKNSRPASQEFLYGSHIYSNSRESLPRYQRNSAYTDISEKDTTDLVQFPHLKAHTNNQSYHIISSSLPQNLPDFAPDEYVKNNVYQELGRKLTKASSIRSSVGAVKLGNISPVNEPFLYQSQGYKNKPITQY